MTDALAALAFCGLTLLLWFVGRETYRLVTARIVPRYLKSLRRFDGSISLEERNWQIQRLMGRK